MEPFATVSDYVNRFGPVADEGMLAECLGDATAAIAAALDPRGIDYSSPSEEFEDRLMRTCRSVANRLMPSGTEVPAGVTQASITAGSYSQTLSYTPSYGVPKLLPSELSMLGVGGGHVGTARPSYGRLEPDDV